LSVFNEKLYFHLYYLYVNCTMCGYKMFVYYPIINNIRIIYIMCAVRWIIRVGIQWFSNNIVFKGFFISFLHNNNGGAPDKWFNDKLHEILFSIPRGHSRIINHEWTAWFFSSLGYINISIKRASSYFKLR